MNKNIRIECADILNFPCDVLVLKHAQAFYGADRLVATELGKLDEGNSGISLSPGSYTLLPTNGKLSATYALFVGVVDLTMFDYGQIRSFARYSLQILAGQVPNSKRVAMTMHGIGSGLDERESFIAQVAGLLDALRDDLAPVFLEEITIVEKNFERATRLRQILSDYFGNNAQKGSLSAEGALDLSIDAGLTSNTKPHVFVAMPFSKSMNDVYIFGIQGPVNTSGYLCERVDMAIFTGDIIDRVRLRIETASLVIADLTGANANVYLEVGYAWGKGKPTLLIVKENEEIKFDVKGQRCIIYETIFDLMNKLNKELGVLLA